MWKKIDFLESMYKTSQVGTMSVGIVNTLKIDIMLLYRNKEELDKQRGREEKKMIDDIEICLDESEHLKYLNDRIKKINAEILAKSEKVDSVIDSLLCVISEKSLNLEEELIRVEMYIERLKNKRRSLDNESSLLKVKKTRLE